MDMPKDPFAFFKAAWPGFQSAGGSMASMAMASSDPAELEKRIADLKTVEQWLDFNLTLLRTTIQGLEIQRGTLLALKAWQNQGSESDAASTDGKTPAVDANLWWTAMQDQFQQLMQAAQNLQTEAASTSTSGFRAAGASKDGQGSSERSANKKPAAKKPPRASASKAVKRP
jgi:hypothetical protein